MGFPLPKVGFPPPTLKRFRYSYSWNRFQLSRNSFFRTNFRSLQKVQYLKLNFWLKSVLLEFPKASTRQVPESLDIRSSQKYWRKWKTYFITILSSKVLLLDGVNAFRGSTLRVSNVSNRTSDFELVVQGWCGSHTVWPEKLLNVNKSSPKKISVDFDTFTKIA